MATIYQSKKSENSNPTKKETTKTSSSSKRLRSKLLLKSTYLISLSLNDAKTKSLTKGINVAFIGNKATCEAILTVKSALITIAMLWKQHYMFIHKTYIMLPVFDSELEAGVIEFKNFLLSQGKQITVNGIVDAQTLQFIDDYLFVDGEYFTNNYTGDFLGFKRSKTVARTQYDSVNKEYVYQIIIINNDTDEKFPLEFKISDPININPIYTDTSPIVYFDLNNNLRSHINQQHPNINLPENSILRFHPDDKITFGDNYLNMNIENLNDYYSNTPSPMPFVEPRLYTIKEGDNLADIVIENFYNTSEVIDNPFDSANPIYSFKPRTIPSKADRASDPRFQYYLNVLYYYNTRVEADDTVKEWGIKAAQGYQRYNPDDCDAINIFDNKFNSSNPQTALPNYYRYIKKLEYKDSLYKINFNTEGKVTSFEAVPGKNIWIPSRQYIESIYNYLNFRPTEMLKEINGVVDYVKESALNALNAAVDTIQEISDNVKTSIKESYKETLEMMKVAYKFAVYILTQYWPRGMGGVLNKKIGVTWGIPLATDISTKKRIWRKMTKSNELSIMYREELDFYVGADAVVGVSAGIGSNMGAGKSKRKSLGLKFGAGIQGGGETKLIMEYEFPIRPEETALISMMIAVFGGAVMKSVAEILRWLTDINLSPEQYLSKLTYGLEIRADAWEAAQIGISGGNADSSKNIKTKKAPNSQSEQESDRSFLNIHNIMDKLPGMGVGVEGEVALGVECEYKAKYNSGCLVFEAGGRVPNEVEFKSTLYAKGTLNTNAMGSFLQKLLMRVSLPAIFSIDFDGGVMVGVTQKGIRNCKASELGYYDVKIPNSTSVSHNKGGLTYGNSPKFSWTSFLEFGKFSGEVEEFCRSGSETKIKLDLSILLDNAQYSAMQTLSKILEIPYSFTFRTKIGASLDTRHSMNLSDEVINAFKNNKHSHREWVHKTELLASAKELGVEAGAYLDVEVEIVVQRIMEILKFYFKKTVIKSRLNFEDQNKLENNIKQKRNSLTNKITNSTSYQGGDFYKKLFTDLNTFLDNNYADKLNLINDYKPALIKYLSAFEQFTHYLEAYPDSKIKELGIDDIINGISFPRPDITAESLVNYSVSLQAQAGIEGSFSAKAGEGATVGLAFEAFAALIDDTILYDDKAWSGAFDMDDPLKAAMLAVKKTLTARSNKRGRNGIESAIGRLKN